MQTPIVEQIRSFNRFYTREIGLLAEHLPESDFTLSEARVLYELAQSEEQTAANIMRSLGMDKAHISRIVARFQRGGLLKSRVSPEHGKHKLLSLTLAGRKAFKRLNQGTEAQIEALVAPLSTEHRQRLVKNMCEIRNVLRAEGASPEDVKLRPVKVGDLGWIASRQAVLYQQQCGWDWTYEGLVCQILGDFVTQFDPTREDAWIADLNGDIVGSIFLTESDAPPVAKLRLLYVEPSVRGLGVGTRLVKRCIARARELGYAKLTLWTVETLVSARKIYQAAGFKLSAEKTQNLFGKTLLSQTWMLDLESQQRET